jgi:hypothetical protein
MAMGTLPQQVSVTESQKKEKTTMKIRRKVTILAVLVVLVLSLIVAVLPVFACTAGCTPGFWKNLEKHSDFWTDHSPGDTVGSVFGNAAIYGLGDDTLLEALQYGGGPGPEGAAQILLRTAVATLLNVAYDEAQDFAWGWGWWHVNLTTRVNDALASGNRDTMIWLAEHLDGWNNQGCPLLED